MEQGQKKETPISTGAGGVQYYSTYPEGKPVWLEGPSKPFSMLSTSAFGQGPVALTYWDSNAQVQKNKVLAPGEKREGGRSFLLVGGFPSPNGGKVVMMWNGIQKNMQNGKPVDTVMRKGLLEVRDTATGHILSHLDVSGRLVMGGSLGTSAWSWDGSRLAMSDEVGRVFLWDTVSGRRVGQLSGTRAEAGGVSSAFAYSIFNKAARLAFTPDGRFLAAGREDGSIYLYSLHSFLPVAQIGNAGTQLRWMQFSPDGHTLYGIVMNGKSVLSWDVPQLNS